MRKKYLSALLFGALLFASAGTFTSCKDYDDDISNLQGQVDGIKADLEDLQAQISAGKWITNVAAIEGGFTVTFSDGQSFNIVNGQDGADGAAGAAGTPGTQWTIGEDGFWYKDGEKTEYKAAIDGVEGKVNVPTIKDGVWYIVNEEGELEATTYKANGATYAVAEANGGFTIYAPTKDGKETVEIYLPGAAGAINSMTAELINNDQDEKKLFSINYYVFAPAKGAEEKWNEGIAKWEKLTETKVTTNKYILSSADKIGLRIDPVNVDAADIDFILINSKNETLNGVTLTPTEYKDYVTRGAYGNGLYELSMESMELKDKTALDAFNKQLKTGGDTPKDIAYAVSASTAIRAEYNIGVKVAEKTANFGDILINKEEISGTTTVDSKATNTVTVETPADLYGMWLSVSEEDKNLFDIKFDQEKHTFTVNADPDVLTKASFVLTIHTLNNNGDYDTTKETIKISNKIAASPEYTRRTLNIVDDALTDGNELTNKNAFTADMATMLTSLGDQVDVWKKKVNAYSYKFFTDKDCKKPVSINTEAGVTTEGIKLYFVDANGKEVAAKDAVNMKFAVTNADASKNFKVDTEYYVKVTFQNVETVNGSTVTSELNSIVIPFQFAIPDFADSFEQESAVFVDGVANAYMTNDDEKTEIVEGVTKRLAAYKLSRAFKKHLKDAKLTLDDKTKVIGDYTSAKLAIIDGTFTDEAMITLNNVKPAEGTNIPVGYGQELIVNASAEDYKGWAYPEGEGTYTFTIKVMSPLYEGTVSAIGDVISIPATSTSGWSMTNEHIEGKTYNNVSYNVLPDVDGGTSKETKWSRPEIAKVQATTANERVVKLGDNGLAQPAATVTIDGKSTLRSGYITVLPQNIAATTETEINITVTDVWGYAKTSPVKVKVTVGE